MAFQVEELIYSTFLTKIKANLQKSLCSVLPDGYEQLQLVKILCPGQNSVAGWLRFVSSTRAVCGQAGVLSTKHLYVPPLDS